MFRSVPLILQLLLWYNLAYLYKSLDVGIPFGPSFFSFDTLSLIDKFGAAVLGLGLHQAAYSAEVVRAGILSVDQGQLEAAASLGIPKRRQATRIVLPQAMRSIVPLSLSSSSPHSSGSVRRSETTTTCGWAPRTCGRWSSSQVWSRPSGTSS